jgi:hypothetical protein
MMELAGAASCLVLPDAWGMLDPAQCWAGSRCTWQVQLVMLLNHKLAVTMP